MYITIKEISNGYLVNRIGLGGSYCRTKEDVINKIKSLIGMDDEKEQEPEKDNQEQEKDDTEQKGLAEYVSKNEW